jgi:hypothetical protein
LSANCRIWLYRIKSAAAGGACEPLRWQLVHIHPGTPGIRFAAPGDRAARCAALGASDRRRPCYLRPFVQAPYERQVVTAEWGTALDCRDGFAALPP